MMTRDDIEYEMDALRYAGFECAASRYLTHDAEQRQAIEQQTQEIERWKATCAEKDRQIKAIKTNLEDRWMDEHGTTWTRPTSWAYAQVCRVRDQQAQELARAKRALERAGYTYVDGCEEWKPPVGQSVSPLLDKLDVQRNTIHTLREALEKMNRVMLWLLGENGEFPDEPQAGTYRKRFWWRTELRKRLGNIGSQRVLEETNS